ncbi:hypothetical protein [Streptomyces sp. NPDC008139]|uniref:hypothetical protein n=1 Tax=Streptomyces sp. NPDC008139 TaxID=3364814 RepID=UPI0036EF671C
MTNEWHGFQPGDESGRRPADPDTAQGDHNGRSPSDPNHARHRAPGDALTGGGYDPGYGGQLPGAYPAEGHGGTYGADAPGSYAPGSYAPEGHDSGYGTQGGPYGGQAPDGYSAAGYGAPGDNGGAAYPGGGHGAGQDAGTGGTGGGSYGGQAPGGPAGQGYAGQGYAGQGYAAPGGAYAGDGQDGGGRHAGQGAGVYPVGGHDEGYGAREYGDHPDGGRTYVPEPLAGPMPPYSEPGAPYAPPTPGDAWGGHAGGADWAQGAAHPHPQAGGVEQTAVLPVVESLPQQTPGRHGDQGQGQSQAQGQPQAPVRTGSPIIAPGLEPAALTAALGLLMAGGAALGKPGLAVLLVVLQAVTAAGWFRLNGMWPARQGIALAFLSGVTADIGLLIAGDDHGPAVLIGTLGVWLLLVLVLQLRHHGSADERMSSLTATSASTLLTVVAAGYLATAASHAGSDPVVVGAVAVALAALVRALPLPGAASVVVALLAAAATGFATGPATGMSGGDAVLIAAACGVCALIGLRVASYDFPSRFVHFTAGVALPLTAAAPAVYILGRVLTG